MGDIGDIWNETKDARKEESQTRRANHRTNAQIILTEHDIKFDVRNEGAHLIVDLPQGRIVDFWPGTGKFIIRGVKHHNRGIFSLIRIYKKELPDETR